MTEIDARRGIEGVWAMLVNAEVWPGFNSAVIKQPTMSAMCFAGGNAYRLCLAIMAQYCCRVPY